MGGADYEVNGGGANSWKKDEGYRLAFQDTGLLPFCFRI